MNRTCKQFLFCVKTLDRTLFQRHKIETDLRQTVQTVGCETSNHRHSDIP